ncbi:MAG: PKD domain-containing protein [Candidatus Acetothermia bacterium]|nr:PKD domain-containing protein [Candidatus Acetothermia bacterium]
MDWENPEDIAGIAAYWFKVGSAPTGPKDGARREIAQKPLIVENPPEGEQPLFVWLEDGMGNTTHEKRAQVLLRFDKTPPTGKLFINDGATRTMELVVTLQLTGQDNASGLPEMRFSNDGRAWSGWEGFAATRQWDLSQFGGSTAPGRKTVFAELRDRSGNVAQLQAQIEYIVAKPPTARFTVTPESPRPGQATTFDASASSSPNGAITRYAWDFGDGTQEATDKPVTKHTYDKEGRYTVRLAVTDVLGLTAPAPPRELVVEIKPATLRVPLDFFTVDEALAAAQPGDILLLSPGFYTVNLVLGKSITLKGTGTPATLQGKDKTKPVLTVQGENVEVRVESLTITTLAGAGASTVLVQGKARLTIVSAPVSNMGTAPALDLKDSARLTLEGTAASPIAVSSGGGTAIQARDQAQLTLANARLSGKSGLALSGSAQATLSGSTITATGGDGLTSSGSGAVTMHNVQITAGKTGVRLSGSAQATFDLAGSTLTGEEAGIALRDTAKLTARGGTIRSGASGIGVDVAGQAQLILEGAAVSGGVVDLRVIERARAMVQKTKLFGGLAGVLAGDSAVVLLQENEITDHPLWGVALATPACVRAELRTLTGHTDYVNSVAFSPDGRLLASGSY